MKALLITAIALCFVFSTHSTAAPLPGRNILTQQKDCSRLYPVKNTDDLLKQLYEHLDSACLLDIEPQQLAKKWQLPVYVGDFFGERNIIGSEAYRLDQRPFEKGSDAFTIVRGTGYDKDTLLAVSTKDYRKKHRSLFPNHVYPDYLPIPDKMLLAPTAPKDYCSDEDSDSSESVTKHGTVNKAGRGLIISKYYGLEKIHFIALRTELFACKKEILWIEYRRRFF